MDRIPQALPWIGQAEKMSVAETLDNAWVTEGSMMQAFRAQLLDLTGARYGVFAPNGTLALVLGLLALDIGCGDEVIVPDLSFFASAAACLLVGARPVLVDVDPMTFQMRAEYCERALTENTKAIMPVHLFGACPDMTAIMTLAEEYGLAVIEDAAQAVGVHYMGQHAGTFGDVGCFSFFADKTVTSGEGGFVVCRAEDVYHKLLLLRNHGRRESGSFVHSGLGWNFRITDMQAALGVAQMDKLTHIITRKRERLEWYKQDLAGVDEVEFVPVEDGSEHVPFRAALLCQRASALLPYLDQRSIQTRGFFYPLHWQPALWKDQGDDAQFPNTLFASARGIFLPVYPQLQRCQVTWICDRIKEFYSHATD